MASEISALARLKYMPTTENDLYLFLAKDELFKTRGQLLRRNPSFLEDNLKKLKESSEYARWKKSKGLKSKDRHLDFFLSKVLEDWLLHARASDDEIAQRLGRYHNNMPSDHSEKFSLLQMAPAKADQIFGILENYWIRQKDPFQRAGSFNFNPDYIESIDDLERAGLNPEFGSENLSKEISCCKSNCTQCPFSYPQKTKRNQLKKLLDESESESGD